MPIWAAHTQRARFADLAEQRAPRPAAAGDTNRQITPVLFGTPETVVFYLRPAYQKLEVTAPPSSRTP